MHEMKRKFENGRAHLTAQPVPLRRPQTLLCRRPPKTSSLTHSLTAPLPLPLPGGPSRTRAVPPPRHRLGVASCPGGAQSGTGTVNVCRVTRRASRSPQQTWKGRGALGCWCIQRDSETQAAACVALCYEKTVANRSNAVHQRVGFHPLFHSSVCAVPSSKRFIVVFPMVVHSARLIFPGVIAAKKPLPLPAPNQAKDDLLTPLPYEAKSGSRVALLLPSAKAESSSQLALWS